MKLLRRSLVLIAACFAFVFVLASCSGSKVSKSYADSINKGAESKNYITYEVAKNDLGKECNDWTMGGNGIIFAVKGFDNLDNEEAFNKLVLGGDENTVYCAILITCVGGNCISAVYVEGTGEQVSQKLADSIKF